MSEALRPDYTIAQIRRVLEGYAVTQEHGLDRGTDGQIAAVCKRVDAWRAICAILSPIEQKVAFYHLLQGRTQDETAEMLRRSQSTISKHARRSIRKMAAWLNTGDAQAYIVSQEHARYL